MDFFDYDTILSLLTLTGLEIVLGVDNVIFIALIVQHLEKNDRKKARFIGLSLALFIRILMLFFATWIMQLTYPLFTIFSFSVSGRSLMLIFGGLFLIVKTIMEFLEMFGKKQEKESSKTKSSSFFNAIVQIIFIDVILSFDSIITAVGLSDNFSVMVIAIVIAMIIMIISSSTIGNFIYSNPSIKVLALAFIGLVGVMLFLQGFDINFNKGYLYFAMFFSGMIEILNTKLKNK